MMSPVQAPLSARRCAGQISPQGAQLTCRAFCLGERAIGSDCACLRSLQHAARDEPVAVRVPPQAVERSPHDVVIVDESRLQACFVALYREFAKLDAAMSVDRSIAVANDSH